MKTTYAKQKAVPTLQIMMVYVDLVTPLNVMIKLASFVPPQAPQTQVMPTKCVNNVPNSSAMIATTFAKKSPQTRQATLMACAEAASSTQNV